MSDAVPIVTEDTLNNTYGFYPNWVPNADQWNAMFGYKVDAIGGSLTDPIVFGRMTLTQPPGSPNDAANKAYVDNVLGTSNSLPDAPTDGTPYCRMNASWVPAPTTVTASVTGDLVVPGSLSVGHDAIITGNLQLGATSNGAYQLDVNGPANFMGRGRFVIDSTSSWLTLTANPAAVVTPQSNTHLQIIGADGANPRIEIDSYSSFGGQFTYRAAGGTYAAPLAILVNQNLGTTNYVGYDGTAFSASQASASCIADAAWSPTSHPTAFVWRTVAVNSVGQPVERMRINNAGNVLIGTTADDTINKLQVSGGGRFDGGSGAFPASAPTTAGLMIAAPDATQPMAAILSFGAGGSTPVINFYRASGTRAAPTASVSAQAFGSVNGFGYGTTGFSAAPRGSVQFVAQEAWTDTAQGTSIAFRATPVTTISTTELMRLFGTGDLVLGGGLSPTDRGYKLDVLGTGGARIDSGAGGVLPAGLTGNTMILAGADAAATQGAMVAFGAAPTWNFYRAGGTRAAPAALAATGIMGGIGGIGYGATGFSAAPRGAVQFVAEENWSDTAQGAAIVFRSTPLTTILTAEKMRLANSGNLLIGTPTDSGYRLDVTGGASRFAATLTTAPVVIQNTGATLPGSYPANVLLNLVGGPSVSLNIDALVQAQFQGRRTNGTMAAPTGLLATNNILVLAAAGYAATGYSGNYGFLRAQAAENWTDTAQGLLQIFSVVPTGSTTITEAMRIQASGNLSIGTATDSGYRLDVTGGGVRFTTDGATSWVTVTANALAALPAPPTNTYLRLAGKDAAIPRLLLDSFGTYSQTTYRASGGTAAAPTAMAASANIHVLGGVGYDGTVYSVNQITQTAATDGVWTATSHPTRWSWATTPVNSIASPVERMRITSAGNLLIAGTVDNAVDVLQVTGSARISTGLGMFGHVAPTTQPSFSGAKGGNTALASVIAILVAMGVALDTTTA
jgi:hypothetical protein